MSAIFSKSVTDHFSLDTLYVIRTFYFPKLMSQLEIIELDIYSLIDPIPSEDIPFFSYTLTFLVHNL